ncbi:MAG TPA: GntR family transcriptional regulator [Candidatus Blautia merdavium]|uniref:GntR family transcriptional regulator n=1 Tax=Candidatus Blautia merdavium TaxID=2838494 RepID=A0A9D2PJF6_9FIRM|nr:GntR family transcriptional regulator [Candidatus Blautia merdavium]
MIVIDYQNRKPIYEQIVDRFQMLIIKGVLGPDAQMPSVRSLAAELSINPNTIQKAYSILEQQGFIYPVKGRGAFVSGDRALKEKKTEVFFGKLRELVKEAKEIGISKDLCLQKTAQFYEEVET